MDWPDSLPQVVDQNGYSDSLKDNVLKSEMDAGPEKKRPRYTAVPLYLTMSLSLTREESVILENFYVTSTSYGILPFNWLHPRTLAVASFRFRSPPKFSPDEDGATASLELEILP